MGRFGKRRSLGVSRSRTPRFEFIGAAHTAGTSVGSWSSPRAVNALLRVLLAGALMTGCRLGAPPSARSETASLGGGTPGRLIDQLGHPPPLRGEEEHHVRQAVLADLGGAKVPGEPSVGAFRQPLAERPSVEVGWPQLLAMFRGQLLDGREVKKGQTSERLLRLEPVATLSEDGVLTLKFETLRPIAGASLSIGQRMPEDPLGLSRYRRRAAKLEPPVDTSTGHRYRLSADAKGLIRGPYDVANVLGRKRGALSWRVELLAPELGTSFVIDGESAFRCDPCRGRGASFLQLPSVRLGPFVDRVGTNRAIISFATDAATSAWVAVVDDRRKLRMFAADSPGVDHEIQVKGLNPGVRYRYQPVIVDARGEVHIHRGATFQTEPGASRRFEFVALSDSRSGFGAADEQYGGTNARVLRDLLTMALVQGQPRAVVFVGDLIDGYTTWPGSFAFQLEMWKRAVQPVHAHVPIYEVMGNHEALLDIWTNGWGADRKSPSAEEIFASQFVNPPGGPSGPVGAPPYDENTFSFEIGTAHLAVINSNYNYRSHPERTGHPGGEAGNREGWIDDRTLEWLDDDLAKAREAGQRHLFVFTHEPGFPNGGHAGDGLYWNGKVPEVLRRRTRLFALLSRHRVTAIIHGDEHNYSRLLVDSETLGAPLERPVWHLVSGGSGAPFYAQDRAVPWSDRVEVFDPRQHFLRFLIDGDDCTIEAVSREGALIDRFNAIDARVISRTEP